jgi:hypothetical protein
VLTYHSPCCRLHFALTICYNLWVMWRLAYHFKCFVLARQHYLSRGECCTPDTWHEAC